MKKIFYILVSCITATSLAQPTEGIVYYTRSINYTKIIHLLPYLTQQQKEKQAYMWEKEQQWDQKVKLAFTPQASMYTDIIPDDYTGRKEVFFVYRDFQKQTSMDAISVANKLYLIEDTLHTPTWKILNEIKEVAGHICMKAVTEDTTKNQKIVAWFAQDIPLSAGPERVYGLPGLILELDINDGAVRVTATRIEQKSPAQEMTIPKKLKGVSVNEEAYQKLVHTFIQDKLKQEQNPFWFIRY